MEIIFEFIVYFVLGFPGALIRWLISGRKKTFKEVLTDEVFYNVTIGLLILLPLIILFVVVF
jgi:hypothetical protein